MERRQFMNLNLAVGASVWIGLRSTTAHAFWPWVLRGAYWTFRRVLTGAVTRPTMRVIAGATRRRVATAAAAGGTVTLASTPVAASVAEVALRDIATGVVRTGYGELFDRYALDSWRPDDLTGEIRTPDGVMFLEQDERGRPLTQGKSSFDGEFEFEIDPARIDPTWFIEVMIVDLDDVEIVEWAGTVNALTDRSPTGKFVFKLNKSVVPGRKILLSVIRGEVVGASAPFIIGA